MSSDLNFQTGFRLLSVSRLVPTAVLALSTLKFSLLIEERASQQRQTLSGRTIAFDHKARLSLSVCSILGVDMDSGCVGCRWVARPI